MATNSAWLKPQFAAIKTVAMEPNTDAEPLTPQAQGTIAEEWILSRWIPKRHRHTHPEA